MTNKEKTDRVIQYLTENHLYVDGGYPYDYAEHAGKLFVATLTSSSERAGTGIDEYELAELPRWYNRAVRYLKATGQSPDWPDMTGLDFGDWGEAFGETEKREVQEVALGREPSHDV